MNMATRPLDRAKMLDADRGVAVFRTPIFQWCQATTHVTRQLPSVAFELLPTTPTRQQRSNPQHHHRSSRRAPRISSSASPSLCHPNWIPQQRADPR
jgi:hypothetical protein